LVSSRLPTREQALKLLRDNGCSTSVVTHCESVAQIAVKTAQACQKHGHAVDVELVEVAALLHDLGRAKTHSVNHAVEGAKIAKAAGLPNPIINIIKRHVGGGITDQEAKALGWPADNYMPVTLEEKIVSHADKLVETTPKRVPIEVTVKELRKKNLNEAADRVLKLHKEIAALTGEFS
jgi:uncharacterized protein